MNLSNAVRLFTVAATLAIAAPAAAQTDQRSGPNPQLFTSGLITTGLSYTPAILVAMNSERSEDKYLYYPLAGPWINLANRNPEGDTRLNRALLVVDGVAQAIGALQIAASLMFISSGDSGSAKSSGAPTVTAQLSPARFGSDGYGVTATGQF